MTTPCSALAPVVILAFTSQAWAGDLNPPAGPVAPTMKTLVEVEPRTAVNSLPGSATAVHRISEPGSYYLTANILGEPGKNGIEVFIPAGIERGVMIDLNGFDLVGVPGSLKGIQSPFSAHVRNGAVAAWGGTGVEVAQGIVENLRVRSNGLHGVRALWSVSIRNCSAEDNAADGFSAVDNCNIIECLSKGNGGRGFSLDGIGVIRECAAYNNTAGGIKVFISSIVSDCVLNTNPGPSIEAHNLCRISGNLILGGSPGILITGSGSRVEGNHVGGLIQAAGQANIIVRNSASVFDIAPGNVAGAITSDPPTAGPWDNIVPQ